MFGFKLISVLVIFPHLKLCVAVARHNFKWVKIKIKLTQPFRHRRIIICKTLAVAVLTTCWSMIRAVIDISVKYTNAKVNTQAAKTREHTWNSTFISHAKGGGPRVVVRTAAFHARARGSVPGLGGLKETKMVLPHPPVKGACSAWDRQGSNFASCVWGTVTSHLSHLILRRFSWPSLAYMCTKVADSFHFIFPMRNRHECEKIKPVLKLFAFELL